MSESHEGEGARAGGGGGVGGRGSRGRGAGRGPSRVGRELRRDSALSRLPEELRALGRSLDSPGADGTGGTGGSGGADGAFDSETMVERVLGQILAEQLPVPVAEPPGARLRLRAGRHWARLRWRSLTAALCGLLTVLALTPPVRAAVHDWFDFGGVEVRYDPSAVPSPGAEVPGCGRSVSLAQARQRAGFEPLVPDALGVPDAVTVTGEPHGRLLMSLCWREGGRTVRLDEFRARLDVGFVKTVRESPEWTVLGKAPSADAVPDYALWFPRPHLLGFWLVDADGHRYTRKVRTAGPTLLWAHGTSDDVTLRLEGVASRARAVKIAKSLESAPGEPSK